jgi:hypothetical protein
VSIFLLFFGLSGESTLKKQIPTKKYFPHLFLNLCFYFQIIKIKIEISFSLNHASKPDKQFNANTSSTAAPMNRIMLATSQPLILFGIDFKLDQPGRSGQSETQEPDLQIPLRYIFR